MGQLERRRVVIAADSEEGAALGKLFARSPLEGWDAVPAHSVAQVRFLAQHDPCEVILLDESLHRGEGGDGLDWLAARRETAVVFLAGDALDLVADALKRGAGQWLPRELAFRHPEVLAAALDHATGVTDLQRSVRRAGELLHDCRRQVGRLVNLLWETAPHDARSPWLTQRHMMERLHEEIARAGRQGAPFAIALGEVRTAPGADEPGADPERLAVWTTEQVLRCKRRADVAGRYGPNGFMMLLVQTPERGATLGCRRLQNALEHAPAPHGSVLAYFGVASYSPSVSSPKSLLSFAERRLEKAKGASSDRLVCT